MLHTKTIRTPESVRRVLCSRNMALEYNYHAAFEMSPSFFTRLATRLFPFRWWFFSTSVVGMVLLFASFSTGAALPVTVAGALAGPIIFVPWALLCVCIWFHPERGNLQSNSKLVGRLPMVIQIGIRWYAAIFLAVFFLVGAVVWPAVSLALP